MSTITVGVSPTPIWSVVAQMTDQLLIVNLDSAANITIGDAGVTALDTGADTIPPQGSLSVPATQSWYAISDIDVSPLVQVTLGGSDWTASPAGIADAMIAAGIPALIAQELSASGVSLLAAPNQLYNIGGVGSPGTGATSLVGWTVPNQCFKTGCYYSSLAGPNQQDAGDSAFQANVKRALPNGRPPITKKFWNPGDYHLNNNFNNMANYYSYGTTVVVCIQPLFTGTGQVSNAEKTNIANFITNLVALGATPSNTIFVVYQEPEVGNPPKCTTLQYTNVLAGVGPTITGAGFGIVPDIGSGAGVAVATSYANAAMASGVTFLGLASDFYAGAFNNGFTLDAMAAIADAHSLPYGVFELGVAPDNFPKNPNISAQYMGYIQNFFQTRQTNNKPNLHFMWYDGQCDPTGAGDLTAPILTPTDPRVAMYQGIFDTLTSSPTVNTGGLTIAASHTTTLTPSDPSITGGLATVTDLSYEVSLGLVAGVGSTNPFAQVILTWYAFDQQPKNQVVTDTLRFFVPMGANGDANGPLVVHGRGRQRGSFLTVKVNNFDSVPCTLQFFQLFDTGRIGSRDTWTWDINANVSPNVPGFTLASAATGSLEVGRKTSQTVAHAGGTVSWLCGIFPGRVYYKLSVPSGSTANDVVFQISPVPTNIFTGSPSYLTEALGAAGNTNINGYISATRCPLLVTVTNNEPANDVQVSFVLNGEETA